MSVPQSPTDPTLAQLLNELARDLNSYCECPPGEMITIPDDGEPEIIVAACRIGPWSINLLTNVAATMQSLTVIWRDGEMTGRLYLAAIRAFPDKWLPSGEPVRDWNIFYPLNLSTGRRLRHILAALDRCWKEREDRNANPA